MTALVRSDRRLVGRRRVLARSVVALPPELKTRVLLDGDGGDGMVQKQEQGEQEEQDEEQEQQQPQQEQELQQELHVGLSLHKDGWMEMAR